MGNFGSKKTPEEMLKENKRMIRKATRELERETRSLERQEKQLIQNIKKSAKEGQMGPVKIMAKDLVRTKKYISKFNMMSSQLQAVGLKLQSAKSMDAMSGAMRGVTVAMISMNKQMNIPQMQRIMQQFAMENERMDMTEEMMSDTIDDVMTEEGDEEEEDEVISKVLDEIGVSFGESIPDAPLGMASATAATASVPAARSAVAEGAASDPAVDELEARLNNLRK
jgi:charged multivesicular body protein 2A